MSVPKAFISYSHDSNAHKQWVLDLATRLMHAGIDVSLDLWELQPGDDLAHFMESHLVSANKVLMVCTDKYVEKANAGIGGVGYEKMIVTAEALKSISASKVIPLIRQLPGSSKVPTFLGTKKYLNFSDEQYEFSFDELLRNLHEAPLFVKPKIGEKPNFDAPPKAEEAGDPILMVVKMIVSYREDNLESTYIPYADLAARAKRNGMSRLYFDVILKKLLQFGYVSDSAGLDMLFFTERGKAYAMEHELG